MGVLSSQDFKWVEAINGDMVSRLVDKCKTGNHRILFIGKDLYTIRDIQLNFITELGFKGDVIVPDSKTCEMITKIFKYNNVINSDTISQGATGQGVLRLKDGLTDEDFSMENCLTRMVSKNFIDIRSYEYDTTEQANMALMIKYIGSNPGSFSNTKYMKQDIVDIIVDVKFDGKINEIMYCK